MCRYDMLPARLTTIAMRTRTSHILARRWAVVAAVLYVYASAIAASRPSTIAQSPKLLVLLVIDQMRADYVDTYGHQWTAGLRTLFDEGAWFSDARYPYRSTFTCTGHATIATGHFPAAHGMILNSWWDRSTARPITCTTDDTQEPVAYGGAPRERHSPHRLLKPTLADLIHEQSRGNPRVVALSLKPRSAITLAGQQADSVVWFDQSNTWATSTFFTDVPVPEVQEYVARHPIESDLGRVWSRFLRPEHYRSDDGGVGEMPPRGWTSVFPHPMGDGSGRATDVFYDRWRTSPFSDEYLTDMAIAMLDAFELGSRDETDYLAVGLSALDYVGHSFGPDSHEVQDVLARLDVAVGRLLDTLDARLGRNGYVVALSSDHGIPPIPEAAVTRGIDAGRVPRQDLIRSVEELLSEHLKQARYVSTLVSGDLYFEPGVYQALRQRPQVLDSVINLIRETPGVSRVYRSDELAADAAVGDSLARKAQLSHSEQRSGDLILIYEPYWLASPLATTHGSPYPYDSKVPVVLYGAGIASGRHATPTTPADIAPTLAFLSGVEMSETDGRVLTEALEGR